MRDLIGELEVVKDDAATALREIDHFDGLTDDSAPIGAFVRAAAALAGCPAGVHLAGRGLTRRFAADGRPMPTVDGHRSPRVEVPGDPGSSVWLERTGAPGPLDDLILERLTRGIQGLTVEVSHSTTEKAVRIACD